MTLEEFGPLARIGKTPLVPLQRLGSSGAAQVLMKCEHLNPTGSIKDRIALAMIEEAEIRGFLNPGMTIVEATAGNTGISLAMIGQRRGYPVVCVIPETMSLTKRRMMQLLGAEVVVAPKVPPDDPDHFLAQAKGIAEDCQGYLMDQFSNPANVEAHRQGTGPEIWKQTSGKLSTFVAGCGSAGTIIGAGRFLKERDAEIEIVLADPEGSVISDYINGRPPRPPKHHRIEGVGWWTLPKLLELDIVDSTLVISEEESLRTMYDLIREHGLLVGPSSGLAVAAALRLAKRRTQTGSVVTVLPDDWSRYLGGSIDRQS